MADIVERLRSACNGHPYAKIAWPHRILHESADEIIALRTRAEEAEGDDRSTSRLACTGGMRSGIMSDIAELIDRYWRLAYAEGRGNRQHDNEVGDAQQCRHEIDRRLKHLLDVGGGSIGLLERAISAEARAASSEKRCEELEAALRDQFCPRPCNGRPDQFGVGDCVDAGECGCSAGTALSTSKEQA